VNARRSVVAALALMGCSTRILQTAEEHAPTDAGTGGSAAVDAGAGGAATVDARAPCPSTLVERLSITRVGVNADIRYKAAGYDIFPEDARIALGVDERGAPMVAWMDDALSAVHVTPLTREFTRAAPDVTIPGVDIGGIVPRADGFTLLTRRDDPGEQLSDPNNGSIGKAAILVRVRGTTESWAVPLTGTTSITSSVTGPARDCASGLNGRLVWNGQKYGVYFTVHGCQGDEHASFYGDKLAYVDDSGAALPGGWAWNCSINAGLRLLPESGAFTSLCLADNNPFQGLNLVVEDVPARLLAPEASGTGYSAGRFGSVVKMDDGTYVVGWLSRGIASGGTAAAKPAQDIALLRLGSDYSSLGPLRWIRETPDVAETNLHLARYGPDRLVVVWDSIEELDCSALTCFGTYAGTHLRLMDATGRFLTPDLTIQAPPNSAEDIAVLPNGDLAWAFVEEDDRNYQSKLPLDARRAPDVPPKRTLSVAHLTYCP